MLTPSEGRRFAKIHKILGRVALVLSLTGTVMGYVAAWTDEGIPRGIIPPIVCINVAIRTYENKSFF